MISTESIKGHQRPTFRGISSFIESKVLINKALVDASVDVPMLIMTNNKEERRERASRMSIGWSLAFLSPFVTLPLTNRLALKFITKTYKNFWGKENRIIEISNKFLKTEESVKNALTVQGKKYGFDSEQIAQKAGGFENLRKRLITAKNAVLSFDLVFTTGSLGGIGYFNNWLTKKKTGRSGFSAEFNMADNSVTDKRAEKFKKQAPIRAASVIALVLSLGALPVFLRKGLINNSQKGFTGKLNKIAHWFDYDSGICMKRFPLFLSIMGAYYSLACASRNKTELKDNIIRSMCGGLVFFGGDLIIGSTLAQLADKYLKTSIIDKNCPKNLVNRIIPPIKHIKDLNGRSKQTATAIFWVNMAILSASLGFGMPALLNKMIKKDVLKDVTNPEQKIKAIPISNKIFKDFSL